MYYCISLVIWKWMLLMLPHCWLAGLCILDSKRCSYYLCYDAASIQLALILNIYDSWTALPLIRDTYIHLYTGISRVLFPSFGTPGPKVIPQAGTLTSANRMASSSTAASDRTFVFVCSDPTAIKTFLVAGDDRLLNLSVDYELCVSPICWLLMSFLFC